MVLSVTERLGKIIQSSRCQGCSLKTKSSTALTSQVLVMQFFRWMLLANHTALRSKNGKIYSIADSAAPISREDGETTGVILVFKDLTEERKKKRKSYKVRPDSKS